ncbi:ABC transporter substrate-binding protein [Burkholderia pseudomultivorans]|uniref:Extracellular solute-binding protein n=1 Tax=Burkholderia pseudomultivorans TaxID=1207504 RepID=A0A6P2MJ32_9BURK|nr:ABC transporter substrate-binding protein [Burkholderia pseudomultivorans]MDR8730114.1 Glutathione-binding protein GsiB [Burkholderia pseudomultivorans]MDR8734699.1 Glutathione-binding protein GsiB [Burkholderia pseudomultivorans]MDR8740665.1 Glutathione-binding protein GsiB [Burkholderia pseudomultivorans]MDR8751670.1 Glutathione-binding protein GsiB [Burkholderia pseudomultivorans]MDR8777079.1 Glutathione-binding protein GsiB [Burkholderia pseudomultivorans]
MKRRDVLKAGAAAVVGSTAALGAPSLVLGQAQKKTLRFIPQADLVLLDPVQTTGQVTRNHGMMVFDSLYGLDSAFRVQFQMLAGHQMADDGKTWTLTLRDKLMFHDKTPVLARDVVASIERWAKTDVLGQQMHAQLNELVSVNDKTIRFSFKSSFRALPTILGKPSAFLPIMPARLAATPPSTQVTEMVGSGPFRFMAKERVPGSLAVYQKFDGYVPREGQSSFSSGPKIAYLDRVEWHTIPDPATAAAAIQSGEMDWWEEPTPDLLPVMKSNSNVILNVYDKGGWMTMLRMNHLNPPFDNPAIRRAVLSGIVQTDYMLAAMGEDRNRWRAPVGFFLPNSSSASDAGMEAVLHPRPISQVRQALAAAGYKGEKVVMLVPTDLARANAISEVAVDYLRKIGMNVDYQSLDWGTVLQRIASKAPVSKGGWCIHANAVPGMITSNPILHTYAQGPGPAKGTFGWPNMPKYQELLGKYMGATDPTEQQRLCRDLQMEAFMSVPYLPTGLAFTMAAHRRNITGIPEGFPQFYNVRKG